MITLSKTPGMGTGTEQGTPMPKITPVGFKLHGHREGLRMNDLTTLHSALVCTSLNGGTAHQSGCDGIPNQGCWRCEGRTF